MLQCQECHWVTDMRYTRSHIINMLLYYVVVHGSMWLAAKGALSWHAAGALRRIPNNSASQLWRLASQIFATVIFITIFSLKIYSFSWSILPVRSPGPLAKGPVTFSLTGDIFFLRNIIWAYWSKRWVVNHRFFSEPTLLKIYIKYYYRKTLIVILPPCKVSNPT